MFFFHLDVRSSNPYITPKGTRKSRRISGDVRKKFGCSWKLRCLPCGSANGFVAMTAVRWRWSWL